ncbi:PE-PGRS family protein [Nocardioides silvaticus]|uniref:PE-PGRS family protein n=1 Tax=Nocardioides silvaticus TaxID=2201891 RepID=A0A316TND6_9ACTN|nr:GNAT family N-acetyltransferase [Nocardioides silvaticus]PWN04739.1 PE-PGRS family protein [Nocardioides silvaticus]
MALEITAVDPLDVGAIHAWVDLNTSVVRHEVGESGAMWTAPEMVAALQKPSKGRNELIYLGTADGTLVATGWITLPMIDNLTSADLYVAVVPEHRRRGLGSAMLAHLEQECAARGRTRLDAITDWPYDGAADGTGAPGVEFGKAHGFAFGLGDVQRELQLPADVEVLTRLAAEAASYHSDYELRTWSGPIPDDLVLSYLELSTRLNTEAPVGDLEREDQTVDIEAHRSAERTLAEQQRVPWHTVALDRDGNVVAYSDLMVPATDPHWVHQWGTLVDPAHRGHRLGVAVKVANLLAYQEAHPEDRRRVITWNAEVNRHMIAINEQMGFVATARGGQLQKKTLR